MVPKVQRTDISKDIDYYELDQMRRTFEKMSADTEIIIIKKKSEASINLWYVRNQTKSYPTNCICLFKYMIFWYRIS